jgi:hypothetical protein
MIEVQCSPGSLSSPKRESSAEKVMLHAERVDSLAATVRDALQLKMVDYIQGYTETARIETDTKGVQEMAPYFNRMDAILKSIESAIISMERTIRSCEL